MAIDDNTTYGLTGAQIKELPGKIEAVKGLARELTVADYNANSSNWSDTDPANFNCVALWKLEPGFYSYEYDAGTGATNVYAATNNKLANKGVIIISPSTANPAQIVIFYTAGDDSVYSTRTQVSDGTQIQNPYRIINSNNVKNNLTTTTSGNVLDARQGKALKDLIDAIVVPTITVTSTDPGEGSALAANNFVAVYGDDPMSYSLTEIDTGTTWIDGSTIYKKTISVGALPNATTKNVNNGITNLSRIINYDAYAYRSSTPTTIPLPFIDTTNLSRGVNITFGASTIAVTTSVDRSDFDECYITLYYTKSS